MNIKLSLTAVAATLAFTLALPAIASDHKALPNFDPSKDIVKPAETLKFVNINPAIKFGPAWGQFSKSEHGTFGKFPPKFKTPFHFHSGAYHGVVIKGRMTNPFKNEKNPPVMEAGSYWFVPAKSIHATACVSAEPCQFYMHASSSFDFQPVKTSK